MASATLPDASQEELDAANSEVQQYAAIAAPIWPAYLSAAGICLWFAWDTLPKWYLVAWIVVYGSFMLGRGLTFRRYHSLPQAQRIDDEALWRRRFTWIMFIYGTLQSLLIAVSIPWLPAGNNFLITWLIFFSSVLVTTVMPLSETNLRIYIGITLIPTAIAWLFVDVRYAWLMSIALVMATALFLKAGFARLATLRQTYLLATQLAESNALLRRANVSRTRMIMEASHDLRQPAHALGMMVERLRYATPGADFEARVGQIENGIFSLSDMLNELMEFSRLDVGEYLPQVEPVNLAAVLGEVDQRFGVVAQAKGLSWSVESVPAWVDSDPWLLRRIINNLVTNALKYTSRGGITVGCTSRGADVAVFVQDTGPGIAPQHQARVFIEYVRLNNSEADEPGMGIGLAFAKRAAEALGHRLRLQSELGVGTQMTLGLTLRAPPLGQYPAAPDTGHAAAEVLLGSRVLLLENDPMLRNSMAEVVSGWGAQVQVFSGAEELGEALRLPGAPVPDMVLADLHLDGELNGLQAVEKIRGMYPGSRIPAILLTGDLSYGIEEQALALQTRVAYKPLRPSRLKALMTEEIARTGAAQ